MRNENGHSRKASESRRRKKAEDGDMPYRPAEDDWAAESNGSEEKKATVKGSSMAVLWMGELLPEERRRRREKGIWEWDWAFSQREGRAEGAEIRWRVRMKGTEVYLPLHRMVADEMDSRDHRHPHNYFEASHLVYHPVQCH